MTGPTMITHGCRLNAVESEAMRRMAVSAGLEEAVIVNTCAVTNEAVRSSRQSVRKARREHPDAKIIVTGCAAQTEPEMFAALSEADAVIGNAEKLAPDEWRRMANDDHDRIRVNDIMSVRDTAAHLIDAYGDRARAFLEVQNGCDHRCTFCIIPYGRGNSRSKPIDSVIEQARLLVDGGHKEIVLTGVDLTSYGADLDTPARLGDLVGAILDNTPGLYRLRLSSIDGAEIDDALMERICGDHRLAPHLHLSLQAGNNLILKRMKRRHTREQAIDLCTSIRARRPEVAFGADIIAGFPTETDAMFEDSLNIIDDAGLSFVHVFSFSPREGTPAARMPQLPRQLIKERAAALRKKADTAHRALLDSLHGSEAEAIVESGGRARLGNFALMQLDASEAPAGAAVRVLIGARDGDMIRGSIIS
ncbi:MAG: tRNA (N(6)-L-threonylcarbamoyladenosine(37)-C(2))-methylthiotransferase MtaB [Pseudomonadota bacterium]